MNNYTVIHLHSDFSNGVTNIDSVTKYHEYIDKAKELGMQAIAFTEHGNVFEYFKKYEYCKSKDIKYIHGVEIYITESLENKIRDNYHCCLYAKNYEGFLEINKLLSIAFDRKDGHYYYAPRITFDELINTSKNIIVTTACIGGILYKGNDILKEKYINFLKKNNDRCFLEIQHHSDNVQIKYNKELCLLSKKHDIPLIVGTDTHALNIKHAEGRKILQEAKNIFFDNESGWDITFKSYDELLHALKNQLILTESEIKEAVENTNKLADMIEEFKFDTSHKYPKLYNDPLKVFMTKIKEGIIRRGINKYPNYEEYKKRIIEELEVYKKVKAIDYMLLQAKILDDARTLGGVQCGYGRGSVNGSIIAYILGITEMDSIKYNLNFFRFLNPSRVTNADCDCDFGEKDREWVRNYIFNMEEIKAADIITFNTIALKGSIRDVARAFKTFNGGEHFIESSVTDEICKNIEIKESEYRKEYPELFKYVDIVNGTIVSIGSHPSGILVSDLKTDETIGLCTLSGNENMVTQLSMKPLDALFYVKLDVLGLDSINIINETCKLVGIERINPDNVDIYDNKVWESIRDDTTAIFQMESDMAHKYFELITRPEIIDNIKKSIPNIRMFDLFMFICGAIRPAGENFRDDAVQGVIKDNGFSELNQFLHETLGYLLLQEQIMQFLVKFCGYSDAESDNVRRLVAKKGDTSTVLDEIERRFIDFTSKTYNVDIEKCKEIIQPFLLDIKSASGYGFSANHNNPYSLTGYIQGYLRYYYPLEFLTTCLNTWSTKEEKMVRITEYVNKQNITINPPKFRYSKADYMCDKETNSIYKGINSIKFLNAQVGDDLYSLRDNTYSSFLDLLKDISDRQISINSRQMIALIKLDFFEEFGKSKKILAIYDYYTNLMSKKQISKEKIESLNLTFELVQKHSQKETAKIFKDINIEELIKETIDLIPDKPIPLRDKLATEIEYLGYCASIMPKAPKSFNFVLALDIFKNKKSITYYPTLYNVKTGEKKKYKIKDWQYFSEAPFKEGSVIKILEESKENKRKLVDGKWTKLETEFNYLIENWEVL